MSLEQRIIDALGEFDGFEPSPDLFARVALSVEEDIARRRRIRIIAAGAIAAAAGVALYLFLVSGPSARGELIAPRWAIEALETLVLTGVVATLGPLIRRFGGIFIEDVFGLDPSAGRRFLRLLDVAYYLVFGGYALITTQLTGLVVEESLRRSLSVATERLAGLLLTMGVLHAVTIAVLPVLGLIFSSTVRQAERLAAGTDAPAPSRGALQAERVARAIVWGVGGVALVGGLLALGLAVGSAIGG